MFGQIFGDKENIVVAFENEIHLWTVVQNEVEEIVILSPRDRELEFDL